MGCQDRSGPRTQKSRRREGGGGGGGGLDPAHAALLWFWARALGQVIASQTPFFRGEGLQFDSRT